MSLAASIKIPMGTSMPSFTLADPNGKEYKSDKLSGRSGVLVIFISNHCPFALAMWPRLIRLANHAKCLGIEPVAINPNIHPKQPKDNPKEMLKKVASLKIDFPYLVDKDQIVAKSFQAQCIPEVFLYDQYKKLAYHGRIDDNWENESLVTAPSLKSAIDALASGNMVERRQISAVGSLIKWRTA